MGPTKSTRRREWISWRGDVYRKDSSLLPVEDFVIYVNYDHLLYYVLVNALDLIWELPFQILIELETALLDDEPHWYKLQTHDESSLPLPQPSPFMPRRHIHGESSSKKLQSRLKVFLVTRINSIVMIYSEINFQNIVFRCLLEIRIL